MCGAGVVARQERGRVDVGHSDGDGGSRGIGGPFDAAPMCPQAAERIVSDGAQRVNSDGPGGYPMDREPVIGNR